jgi:hypothetical protein
MTISYRQSNAVTEDHAITIDAQLDDNTKQRLVDVYYDNTFGTWILLDREAEFGPAFLNAHTGEGITPP